MGEVRAKVPFEKTVWRTDEQMNAIGGGRISLTPRYWSSRRHFKKEPP